VQLPDGSLVLTFSGGLEAAAREKVLAAARSVEPQARLDERKGGLLVLSARPLAPGTAEPVETLGAAWRGKWVEAFGRGALPAPLRGLSFVLLPRPPSDAPPERLAWRRDKVHVIGPAWHGPATFLALRTLHDVCHGLDPTHLDEAGKAPDEPAPGAWAPLPEPVAPRPPPEDE
jgi:hypothetical protein